MIPTPDRDILSADGPAPARTARYGPAAHQVYDVFEPDGAPRAWLVLVHGGFWREAWDRTHLRPLAGALTDRGYAVALVEYARSGMPGGGWPTTGEDVAAALAAVRRDEVGDLPVVLVGHSAGGHLAVWTLHRPEARGVTGAVSLAGCLDLHLVHELGLGDGAAEALLGSTPATAPATWAGADPTRLGRAPYPVVVLHGDQDEQVPLAVARSWWEQARTPGRDLVEVLPGTSHFPVIDPRHPSHDCLLAGLRALLDGDLGHGLRLA